MTVSALVGLLAVASLSACTPRQIEAYMSVTEKHHDVLTWDQLKTLRMCESGDNYRAVGGGGLYRGAYQFTRGTWDGVAARHYPFLEGQDPRNADTWWQDAMARALWSERGRQPWPHCGRQV